MKPILSLIPRLNFDYDLSDLICGIKSTFLEKRFDFKLTEPIFGKRTVFFTNSGRTSLYIILKALNLPKGSNIGVPLYSCTSVYDAIIKAGYVPYFIDIDLDTYTTDPSDLENKIKDLSAIIVIHTFGHPADMDKIKRVADDIPIIEDCAQSLLSEYKNKKTGTMGCASFFSFRLGKYISAGEGGMIIVNHEYLNDGIKKEVEKLSAPSAFNEIKHSYITYIKSFLHHKPWFGTFVIPMSSILKSETLIDKKDFKIAAIRKADLAIFFKKLYTFKENVEKQRQNSKFLLDRLKDTSLILPYEKEWAYSSYYLFAIRFDNKKERDTACEYLRTRGVDSARFWETYQISKLNYGYKGDCPNTEMCAQTIATLPNYYRLSFKELLKIVSTTKEVIKLP